jgi:hypothetical protein
LYRKPATNRTINRQIGDKGGGGGGDKIEVRFFFVSVVVFAYGQG